MKFSIPAVWVSLSILLSLFLSNRIEAAQPTVVQLANFPSLTPDGKRVLFSWGGDIWSVSASGGKSKKLTSHPAEDEAPLVSPDGQWVAFNSNRSGDNQVWVMGIKGGAPRQVTFHSEGSRIADWYPNNEDILIEGHRDFATKSSSRFFRVNINKKRSEILLFDAEGYFPSLSADGKKLLFCRETGGTYRRGYRGSNATQIWMAENLETAQPKYTKLIARNSSAKSPMWKSDGSGFYYLGDHGKNQVFNVWDYTFGSPKGGKDIDTQLTKLKEPAVFSRLAESVEKMVFRSGFDLYTFTPGDAEQPDAKKMRIRASGDNLPEHKIRRTLSKADNISFSPDGLEMVFAAGGDLWTMDTLLKEPVAVTNTPEEEREPVFSRDGKTLFFIRDNGKTADIWSVKPATESRYWWRNVRFTEKQISKDGESKFDLQSVPGVDRICWIGGLGNLWCTNYDGSNPKLLLESWNQPSYSWSPGGEWVAWAVQDSDFNRDVWIAPYDGHREPFNLSRHPDYDGSPTWSPDGKILAFVGRRFEKENDIYYVYLKQSDDEQDKRDRLYKSAVKKMETYRKKKSPPEPKKEPTDKPEKPESKKATPDKPKPEPKPKDPPAKSEPKSEPAKDSDDEAKPAAKTDASEAADSKPDEKEAKPKRKLDIDFEGLYERIHRVSIPAAAESRLLWSHDSKRLAFAAEIKGSKGTYAITFPDKLTPVSLTSKQGSLARWISREDRIFWLVDGVPQCYVGRTKGSFTYSFRVQQEYDRREYWRVGFWQIWRTIRDNWYDENLNNLAWDKIGAKYESAAANSPDSRSFDRVVEMMLGELNGSHLGFRSNSSSAYRNPQSTWRDVTRHLGVTFDRFHKGKGWKVKSVLTGGPADQRTSYLRSGDIVVQINQHFINNSEVDPYKILNGQLSKTQYLKVIRAEDIKQNKGKKSKPEVQSVSIRPISYYSARALMRKDLERQRRQLVDKLSDNKLGYVHIPRMAWNEFIRFEEDIFARGAGKDGLIIDVRDNAGGFTADHLLTVLTPSQHTYTIPRGGSPGYPQDRLVYATWKKPITVLCNEHSFSNAEIFSHAIKELQRGQLVGVPTAGGVISTGSDRIRDIGTLRLPYRGWYRNSDGADLELNGAEPDHLIRSLPGEIGRGEDRQIEKAVEVLLQDVKNTPDLPKPRPASSLRKGGGGVIDKK